MQNLILTPSLLCIPTHSCRSGSDRNGKIKPKISLEKKSNTTFIDFLLLETFLNCIFRKFILQFFVKLKPNTLTPVHSYPFLPLREANFLYVIGSATAKTEAPPFRRECHRSDGSATVKTKSIVRMRMKKDS